MTVAELKERLAKYPDDMRVVCFDGECHDAPAVVAGVIRGESDYVSYGVGAREDAVEDNEDDDTPDKPITDVCVIKPDFV